MDPSSLELKELPKHLEYAYLDEECRLPVIISLGLTEKEKEQLLSVLRLHKKAIAWKIVDIKGLNPSFCTHKILMEDEYRPSAQHQRRLNPNMQEVVKKEVIKLLDAGLIYPISDLVWVSPVQVVPKKGGMTVVSNDRNELIPTRTVTRWRVCIDYRNSMMPLVRTISLFHSSIRCWKGFQGSCITVSWTVSRVIFKDL